MTAPPDLLSLFQALLLPMAAPTRGTFCAVRVPGAEHHRLAKDASGAPCLLIARRAGEVPSAPIILEHLTVYHDVECAISHPDGASETGTFTILSCSPQNPALFPHFLQILAPLTSALGSAPTAASVRRMVSALVELFRALSAPAKKTIQGLWAELFLIATASDASALVAAWHKHIGERFDFAAGHQRIEVKSSSTRIREHHFRLNQLLAIGGARVVVASMFVERSGGGITVGQLASDIRRSIANNDAIAQFDATFYATLGANWSTALNEAFDGDLARDSLLFFRAEDIPQVNAVPTGVTEVTFRSDLSHLGPLPSAEMSRVGGLFADAVAR